LRAWAFTCCFPRLLWQVSAYFTASRHTVI
jgi:hypothetical protein